MIQHVILLESLSENHYFNLKIYILEKLIRLLWSIDFEILHTYEFKSKIFTYNNVVNNKSIS
jgi:hypothetical protein